MIITEGTSPSPNGLGYPRIPGIFSAAQVAAWTPITEAVHAKGAKIFMQFMHCGRNSHPLNLPADARVLGPSATAATGEIYTDAEGMKANPIPAAMTKADIETAIEEFAQAAKNAVLAGFDGVELHGANGYLLEQFIRPNSNQRTDQYGGSIENRARFVLEVVDATIAAIGKDKVGIRLSPFGVFNDMAMLAFKGYDQLFEQHFPIKVCRSGKHVRKLWIYFGHQQLISTLNARHRRTIIKVYMPLPVGNGTTLAPAIHPSTISAQL